MPANRRKPRSRRSQKQRLDVSATGVLLPTHVPKRWVKFLVGLFLIPPAWVLTQTFFTAFARTTLNNQFWITPEFWFFGLGAIMWLVTFFSLPKFLKVYVFGHELTHAIWVLMMGGKVHRFEVSAEGGHILADRTNTWIALAPYFFPIYSVVAILLYGVAGLFMDVSGTPYREILYGLVGAGWAFHLSFTVWMIPKGQPDLHYGGTFFSLMVIYLLNISLLAFLLIFASPHVSFTSFGRELWQNAMDFTVQATLLFNQVLHLLVERLRG
jgi:hypothetical protein